MIPTILTLFAVAVILGLAAAAALAVLRRQNARYARRFNLVLQNNGNMRSRYELQSNDPSGLMIFNFLANGSALGMPQGIRIAAGGSKGPSLNSTQDALGSANMRVQQARFNTNRVTASIGGFFTEFGGLLPGALGSAMRNIGRQMTGVDMQMQRVQLQVGRVSRMASIAGDAAETTGKLAGKVQGQGDKAGAQAAPAPADDRAITPYIEPGAQLKVELMVAPADPRNARSTSFSVLSRSTDNSEADVVMQQGVIDYSNLSNTRYILSYVLIGAATLAALWAVLFALPAWGR